MDLRMLIYCTKAKDKHDYLRKLENGKYCIGRDKGNSLNGKIVAVHDYELAELRDMIQYTLVKAWHVYLTPNLEPGELKDRSCLTSSMLDKYKPNYAIHIKNLYKFIKPKELKDLYIKGGYHNAEQMFTDEIQINGEWFHPMKKAPQNMCYAYDKYGNKYIVISVRPEWLAMILNGIKTIELRRKVLKKMK